MADCPGARFQPSGLSVGFFDGLYLVFRIIRIGRA